jgi:hypothetical protein
MELQINEKNVKRVTFVTDPEDEVEDVLYEDIYTEKEQHTKNQTPNIGKFQTINRPKVNPTNIKQQQQQQHHQQQNQQQQNQQQQHLQQQPPQKRKPISYDDILKSMNMKLGPDGKLQMYSEKLQEEHINQQIQQQHHQQNHQHNQIKQHQQQHHQQPHYNPIYHQNQPIYQTYSPQNPPVETSMPPLTKRQYQQMLAIQILRRQQQQQRIKQIKSTKLLFPNPNVIITTSSRPTNRLFGFK